MECIGDASIAEPIQVWSFGEAPRDLQALSGHGGDEDWVALVPDRYGDVAWLDALGICEVSEHTHPDYPNCHIYIGAHA